MKDSTVLNRGHQNCVEHYAQNIFLWNESIKRIHITEHFYKGRVLDFVSGLLVRRNMARSSGLVVSPALLEGRRKCTITTTFL
jgi:hypothetical protein